MITEITVRILVSHLDTFSIQLFFRVGLGSHYGTFGGPPSAFSPLGKQKRPYVSPGKNFLTNPSKKGTGYGYVNVLIGKPQQHAQEPYDRAKEIRVVGYINTLYHFIYITS